MGLHGGRPSLEMNNSPSREFLSSFLIDLPRKIMAGWRSGPTFLNV